MKFSLEKTKLRHRRTAPKPSITHANGSNVHAPVCSVRDRRFDHRAGVDGRARVTTSGSDADHLCSNGLSFRSPASTEDTSAHKSAFYSVVGRALVRCSFPGRETRFHPPHKTRGTDPHRNRSFCCNVARSLCVSICCTGSSLRWLVRPRTTVVCVSSQHYPRCSETLRAVEKPTSTVQALTHSVIVGRSNSLRATTQTTATTAMATA